MLLELRHLLVTALDKEITEAIERVVAPRPDITSDSIQQRVGHVRGLRRARDLIGEVFKDHLTAR